MEEYFIKLIKSLDRVMDTWDKLTLRRSLLVSFTVLLLLQTIMTTIIWLIEKEISTNWLGVLTVEHTSWVIMVSYYFKGRNRSDNNGE